MKIAIVCSHGGHLTETLQILNAFEGYEIFFCTYSSSRDDFLRGIAPTYFMKNIGYSMPKMVTGFFWAWKVLWQERPDVILSLGAEIAVPFFYVGKLLGIRTIFIETRCRVETLSLTGKLVYPVADVYWVQWPGLLEKCGPKAAYMGAVI